MTVQELNDWGAATQEGLQRCINNEGFYLRMVGMIPNDVHFQELYDAIGARDLDKAFEAAHALKGSTGNLALSPLFDPICEITELLRARTDTDYTGLIGKIRAAQEELIRICG